jgi:hypothetical protein
MILGNSVEFDVVIEAIDTLETEFNTQGLQGQRASFNSSPMQRFS